MRHMPYKLGWVPYQLVFTWIGKGGDFLSWLNTELSLFHSDSLFGQISRSHFHYAQTRLLCDPGVATPLMHYN